jgi:hypothetical protein
MPDETSHPAYRKMGDTYTRPIPHTAPQSSPQSFEGKWGNPSLGLTFWFTSNHSATMELGGTFMGEGYWSGSDNNTFCIQIQRPDNPSGVNDIWTGTFDGNVAVGSYWSPSGSSIFSITRID